MGLTGRIGFELKLKIALALILAPAVAAAALGLWTAPYPLWARLGLASPLLASAVWAVWAIERWMVRPLYALASLLAAYRSGDFSVRAHAPAGDDILAQVLAELNALGDTLREQRLTAQEALAFLRRVMEEIDVAILVFGEDERLRLANHSAGQALGQAVERLIGRGAEELGLGEALSGETPRIVNLELPSGQRRFELRRGFVRQGGLKQRLVVLSNLDRLLRDEERQAWQRLIRVLTHELNNSLAPIRSVAGSLTSLLIHERRGPDWEEDMRRGLGVIGSRAEALGRFTEAYSRLARLPAPRRQPLRLAPIVETVAALETRVPIAVEGGPDVMVSVDRDQIEQALINLLRNGAEAALETHGAVRIGWSKTAEPGSVEIVIEDGGPGLKSMDNLFVPFFTTKAHGSGIGMVLSRQIVEAHEGSLTLRNREGATGCRASVRLPIAAQGASTEGRRE